MITLDKCDGNCNTFNDISNKICVPNKTEDVNLSVFDLITRKNESKTLTKHIPCEFKYKFDGRKCNLNQISNNNKCCCECKNLKKMCVKKVIFEILLHVVLKMVDMQKALLTI